MRRRRQSEIDGFQQLLVDAVELAGRVSPFLKRELLSILGSTFPTRITPSASLQATSFRTVLGMFRYARLEADRFSSLRASRQQLDTCIATLLTYENQDLDVRNH